MNVVFIVLDTVRKDFISAFNDEIDFTENIQEIADEGTVFQNAVSQAPWTLPVHASMFTGLYPWEHGATQTNLELTTSKDLLAEKLREHGYKTACYSANPFVSRKIGTTAGFNKVKTTVGMEKYGINKKLNKKIKALEKLDFGALPKIELWLQKVAYHIEKLGKNETEELMDSAMDFMKERQEEDFFVFMNLMDCHLPLYPDKEYKRKHAEDVNPSNVRQYPHRLISEGEEPQTEALRKLYSAQMDYLDDQIGELNSFLEDQGLEEDTLLVLVGDHGENLGEEGMIGHSFSVNEALVSVPLVMKGPGMKEFEDRQIELRELYNFVMKKTGVIESADFGTKYAKGGMDRPEMDLVKLPSSMREEYDEELYFVRTEDMKAVKSSKGSLEINRLSEGETRKSVLKKELEKLENSYNDEVTGKNVESMDEEIKNELQNLGYMQK